jgi:serine protease Do
MRHLVVTVCALGLAVTVAIAGGKKSREEKVREDRARVEASGWWIYQDLPRAFAEARAQDKPIVVVLRCVPCEDCVALDDEVVDQDPRLKPLLERFVRARVVGTNGLDLATFQFDTDQSWLVFLLRHDGTIYGRFGTRSDHAAWSDDVSVAGLARALEGALEMHAAWPRDREALAKKRGPAPRFDVPEAWPALAGKYGPALDFAGKVVPSCVHCHQIGEAVRAFHRGEGRISDELLFPHPHPRAIGLVLDPAERATVRRVEPSSAAAAAGLEAGDVLLALDGMPLLSAADVQWALHGVPAAGGSLAARVRRGDAGRSLTLALPAGWRRADDIAWRASTWELRRMALGGVILKPLGAKERENLPKSAIGLRVEHVGQYAPHDLARRAGVTKGDVLLALDGRTDFQRETDILRYVLQDKPVGSTLGLKLRRGDQELDISLTLPR